MLPNQALRRRRLINPIAPIASKPMVVGSGTALLAPMLAAKLLSAS